MDRKSKIGETIPEICEMRNCNNCVFVEMRKKMDAYMWYGEVAGADATRSPQRAPLAVPHSPAPAVPHARVTKLPSGPSVRFLMQNGEPSSRPSPPRDALPPLPLAPRIAHRHVPSAVHTMDELKLTGNSLRGARPLLHFDPAFESAAHWRLIKELFFQVQTEPSRSFVARRATCCLSCAWNACHCCHFPRACSLSCDLLPAVHFLSASGHPGPWPSMPGAGDLYFCARCHTAGPL